MTREISDFHGVRFDATRVCLTGTYADELSLFRAKRSWSEILEDNFLLEKNYDYEFTYHCDTERLNFILNCEFVTSCGRYAFWRLTNNQAPEAQYLIETAHIPNAELRHDEFLSAPDLEPVCGTINPEESAVLNENSGSRSFLDVIVRLFRGR
ncbi:MAG: hypothetical protein J5J00_15625 [Deltaproteobacteria bacterium]|nr:hypothetical protein [Deltaproteobacteria bacterium]